MELHSQIAKKGVGVLIVNDNGEFFLAQRGEKARSQIGYWENVGGGIESGEEPEDAAKREAMEEIGVEIEIKEQLPMVEHTLPDNGERWESLAFVAGIPDGQTPTIMEEGKIVALGWFKLDNLPEPLAEATRADFIHYKKLHPNAR